MVISMFIVNYTLIKQKMHIFFQADPGEENQDDNDYGNN